METSILSSTSLEAGLTAIQQGQHQDAIAILEAFCHDCAVNGCCDRDYLQAQMHLVKIYQQTAQIDRAVRLARQLHRCRNAQVQIWAQQTLHQMATPPTPAPVNLLDVTGALARLMTRWRRMVV